MSRLWHPKNLLAIALLLFTAVTGSAQKQNYQWRFGRDGGLSFQSLPPKGVTGSKTTTFEGSASVADRKTGNLLFYTDGVTVYNRNNNIMQNGSGLTGGDPVTLSSTTAAVVLPRPGNPDEYYVVTADEQGSGNGVRYSLVDMKLDGGLGGIASGVKNILLLQTGTEKLEVVPAANGKGIWLLTHDNPGNSFYAFLLTSSGFQPTPVVSSVGGTQGNGAGHMKINRQFNRLAMGSLFDASIELFKFDNATGIVSDPVVWKIPSSMQISPLIYGLEFSPKGRFLYASNLFQAYQFDVSTATAAAIGGSAYLVSSNGTPATMQLGPDGQLYINSGGLLDVVQCPDKPGQDCGFISGAAGNQGGGGYGLPKWVYYADDTNGTASSARIRVLDSCAGRPTKFSLEHFQGTQVVSWNFGDPASGAANEANGIQTNHIFSQPGFYNIRAMVPTPCGTDTFFFVKLEIVDCGKSCKGSIDFPNDSCVQNRFSFRITSSNGVQGAVWDFGDPGSGTNNTSTALNPEHRFSDTGTFKVRCIATLDCGVDTVVRFVRVIPCKNNTTDCALFIPNVLTPNRDSLNDRFGVETECSFETFELSVYNRWGQLLYRSTSPDETWDGKYRNVDCPEGVYFFLLDYRISGNTSSNTSGTLTLIR